MIITKYYEDGIIDEVGTMTPMQASMLRSYCSSLRKQIEHFRDECIVYEDALREIVDAGSRQVMESFEKEDGSFDKRIARVDMSIEAITAYDALKKVEAMNE